MSSPYFKSFKEMQYFDDLQKKRFIPPQKRKSAKKTRFWGIFFVVIFLIFLTALAGFLFFQKGNQLKWGSEKVDLKMFGQNEAISGEEVEYTISLKNNGGVALNNPELSVSFPQGFLFDSSQPEFSQKLVAGGIWTLDKIISSQAEEMKIKGMIFGKIDEQKVFNLALSYKPENFSSSFLDTTSFETKITSSLISAEFDLPQELMSGKEVEAKIRISKDKETEENFKNVKIVLEYPTGFKMSNPEMEMTKTEIENTATWLIDELKEEREINFKCFLSGEENEIKNLKLKIFLVNEKGDDSPVLTELSKDVKILLAPLSLKLKINDLDLESQNINLGDSLDYKIDYKNQSKEEIKDVVLEVDFIGDDILNWDSLQLLGNLEGMGGGEVDRGGRLIFSKSQIPSFSALEPGQGGEIEFKIQTLVKISGKKEEIQFSSQAKVSQDNFNLESNPVDLRVNSQLDLRVEGRYFSDEYVQLGSGPLPPKKGETTSYEISWHLANTSNDIDNVKISAKLPDYVKWQGEGSATQGIISYNDQTKEVVWQIEKINSYSGGIYYNLGASFKVSITPTQGQVGQILILTQNSFLSGKDYFTGEDISRQKDSITTDLKDDSLAGGKGRVSE